MILPFLFHSLHPRPLFSAPVQVSDVGITDDGRDEPTVRAKD